MVLVFGQAGGRKKNGGLVLMFFGVLGCLISQEPNRIFFEFLRPCPYSCGGFSNQVTQCNPPISRRLRGRQGIKSN